MNRNIAVLVLSAFAFARSSAEVIAQPVDFQRIGANLTTTMLKCPERIWPNYNWRAVNVLMGSGGQTPVIWRGQSGELSPLPANQIPVGSFGGTYSFPSFEGKQAVAIYLSADVLSSFRTNTNQKSFQIIAHEGFHINGQVDWTMSAANQRGTYYPITSSPRLYRRMMFDRLKKYFLSGGKSTASLAKAAYWNTKWKTEFPDEFRNSMDLVEGTARYVEYISSAVAEGSCQISESDIYSAMANRLNTDMGFSVSGKSLGLDLEAYDIGTLAGFILRFIAKDSSWNDRVAKGTSPLDIVFENVSAVEDVIPTDLGNQFQQFVIEQNKAISGWLDNDMGLIKNRDTIRIVPNDGSFQKSSYVTKGFFLLSAMPGVIATSLAKGVNFHNHTWKLNVAADKVMFGEMKDNPCSGRRALAALQNVATVANGRIKVHGSGLDGSMEGVLKTSADGSKWFCEDVKAGVTL